jgi:MoaA/NifB/PqqE/SkfB family radical SAM enzyme
MMRRAWRRLAAHPRAAALRSALAPPAYEGTTLTARRLLNLWLSRWEEARGRVRLRSYPIKLTVEATNVCNLGCPACFTGVAETGRRRSHMSLELYRRLLAELGPYLFEVELHNWGEPLLGRHVYDMIREATDRGISTTVSTNFSIPFDAERAERLVASGLTVLGVSIDGARQETYEQYRVGGRLDTVLRNCRLVTDAKKRLGARTPRMVWEFHVFPHNSGDVDQARALARDLDMDISVDKGWTVGPEWDPDGPWRFFWYPSPPARCRFLWQQAVVHNDGGVAPCCGTFYQEDDFARLADGATAGGGPGFRALWNNQRFRTARGLFRSRTGPPEARSLVCFECPLTKVWERWQGHLAAGGVGNFDPGYGTNECFNYFWDRRPARAGAAKQAS